MGGAGCWLRSRSSRDITLPHEAPNIIFSLQREHRASERVSFVLLCFVYIIRMFPPSFMQKFGRIGSGESKMCRREITIFGPEMMNGCLAKIIYWRRFRFQKFQKNSNFQKSKFRFLAFRNRLKTSLLG